MNSHSLQAIFDLYANTQTSAQTDSTYIRREFIDMVLTDPLHAGDITTVLDYLPLVSTKDYCYLLELILKTDNEKILNDVFLWNFLEMKGINIRNIKYSNDNRRDLFLTALKHSSASSFRNLVYIWLYPYQDYDYDYAIFHANLTGALNKLETIHKRNPRSLEQKNKLRLKLDHIRKYDNLNIVIYRARQRVTERRADPDSDDFSDFLSYIFRL